MPAHFLYARFPERSHRSAVDWLRAVADVLAMHGDSVRVTDAAAPVAGTVVGWRLLTENHRELGRSAQLAASEAAARADVARLIGVAHRLNVRSDPEPGLRTTGWFVVLDEEIIMIGARRYENRSVARNAGALAVRLLVAMQEESRSDSSSELAR
ncbi:hypothetical protein [Microbacterium binotii]|uniref:hypothetical protein n=1 Tax=Microbacterium binotii TaxID=462710 RepID=UPI001F26C0A7|nr:hypothetical protein [Microbacterium binotii]UIN29609.1 hypothetical protein LXM64_10660 [Microbacterium binotii]